ncbi:MAG: RidA family protein [Leucobacter sp.]
MSRTLVNPASLHPAPGFSHAAIDEDAGIAYVAGQLGLRADFSPAAEDLGGQTRAAMENIGVILDEIGATWDDVMRRTVYTLHPTEFGVITEAIEAVQGSDRHPAQTIIGVTGLALDGLLIEIEATVALPKRRG